MFRVYEKINELCFIDEEYKKIKKTIFLQEKMIYQKKVDLYGKLIWRYLIFKYVIYNLIK